MKYYIIAGEASGDLHGSNLIKGIFKKDPDAHIRCILSLIHILTLPTICSV